LLDKKTEVKKQLSGTAYFNSILDKINIESSVANRAMMPDYLDSKRFPWVFFADSFMWPLNNERETGRNPDEGVFIPLQEKMLHRWMKQVNVNKLPASFADYLRFVSRVLEDNSRRGGIAMKFEVAYFRPMSFSDPSSSEAEEVYQRYVTGGVPTEKEYRTFQDFIFRYLLQEGGRLHLPVHIHTAVGIGDYFNLSKSNIIATALFGDGAAALLISTEGPGLRIEAWGEHTWPQSLDVMGWDVKEDGLGVLFSRDIPALVRDDLRAAVDRFLLRYGLDRLQLAGYVCHPGGAKVLDALEEAFEIPRGALRSRENYRQCRAA